MKLIQYIPASASYVIYYPETFLIDESEDGIVAITSPETDSNLTISSYNSNVKVTEEILKDLLNQTLIGYKPISDFLSLATNLDILIERSYLKDDIHWIWWGLSSENEIRIISCNSQGKLSEEDYNLYRFMIDQIEIISNQPDDLITTKC
jgi:hypothetical protein